MHSDKPSHGVSGQVSRFLAAIVFLAATSGVAYAQLLMTVQERDLVAGVVLAENSAFGAAGRRVFKFDPGFGATTQMRLVGGPTVLEGSLTSGIAVGDGSVFATTNAAFVYAMNQSNLAITAQRDMRRANCATDSIFAPPLFYDRPQGGLVIVATAHGCGDATRNQVIALRSSNINATPAWVFNLGEYEIDALDECIVEGDSIICTARAPLGMPNNATVLCIDAATGALRWTFPAGTISTKPAIGRAADGSRRLYVINAVGRLYALDPDNGAPYWTANYRRIAVAGDVVPQVQADVNGQRFLVVDLQGRVHASADFGDHAEELWISSSNYVLSTLIPSPYDEHVYAGDVFGVLHQFDLAGGSEQARSDFSSYVRIDDARRTGRWSDLLIYQHNGQQRLIGAFAVNGAGFTIYQQILPLPCPIGSINCVAPADTTGPKEPTPAPAPEPAPAPAPTPPPTPPPSVAMCPSSDIGVRVFANAGWCDSGVAYRRGQMLRLRAMGQWSNVGPPSHGPEGFAGYRLAGTVVADADLASLVLDIGGARFQGGTTYQARMNASGHVLLAMNDVEGTYGDNEGYVDVAVMLER